MTKPPTKAASRDLTRALNAAVRALSQSPKPMTQAAFARSRGLSRQYVNKCLLYGILSRSVVTIGKRRLLDPVLADKELHDNRPGQIRVDRL
jgi:hypothetical protein